MPTYREACHGRQAPAWMKMAGACALGFGILLSAAAPGKAACYGPNQQLPAQIVTDFVANPAQLLQQYPNGGPQMISRIRDLAASSPTTLRAIMSLVATASKDQKTAIGTGLGQAARVCVSTDQAFANDIQQAIAASTDGDVKLAYQVVAGDVATAAVGVGAGGASGGVATAAALIGSGGGGLQAIPGSGVGTHAFSYTPGVGGGGGSSVSTTTTIIGPPGSSVSP